MIRKIVLVGSAEQDDLHDRKVGIDSPEYYVGIPRVDARETDLGQAQVIVASNCGDVPTVT